MLKWTVTGCHGGQDISGIAIMGSQALVPI